MAEAFSKDRLLALVDAGARHREEQRHPPAPEPPPQEPQAPEAPPEGRVHRNALRTPRRMRQGLSSDPEWKQKTSYYRRETLALAEQQAKAMGVEFSELAEFAVANQVNPETRHSLIDQLLQG